MKKDTLMIMNLFNKAIAENKCEEIEKVVEKELIEYIDKIYDVLNMCNAEGSLKEIKEQLEYCFGKREMEVDLEHYIDKWLDRCICPSYDARYLVSMLNYSMPTDEEIRVARYCFKTGSLSSIECYINDLECKKIISIDDENCITAKLSGTLIAYVEKENKEIRTRIKFETEANIRYIEDTEEFCIKDKKIIQSIRLVGANQKVD